MLFQREIRADLCVVGGGMAGICAAIAAAREGASVVLMHERPVLGGNASSEIRMWVCGAKGKGNRETGILEEIALENLYRNPTKNYYLWDTVLLEFVRREKNLTLLLNCTCMDAEVETGAFADGRTRRIHSVTGYQMTTQTMIRVTAKLFSDCSGDSILAPLTGADFRIGREAAAEFGENTHVEKADLLTMGNSCLIQGRETSVPVRFQAPEWSTKLNEEHFRYRKPDLYDPTENFWYLELGGNRDTIRDAEEIAEDLVPLALGTWDHIKNSGLYKAENWELDFLGFLPGKRESRRMMGEFLITEPDITENRSYPDTVAFGGWPVDDHFPDGFYHKGTPNTDFHTPAPYQIPYRALYSKNVENLFFAGRNISMTHTAMSSVRVMATCALLGQAVGVAASLCTRFCLTPNGVAKEKIALLQEKLMDADCFLPALSRKVDPLCREQMPEPLCDGRDRPHRLYGTEETGIDVKNQSELCYRFDSPVPVKSIHLTFDSDLERTSLPGDWCEREHSTRCNTLLSSPTFSLPKALCRSFVLTVTDESGKRVLLDVEENRKRSYHVEVGDKVKEISLCIRQNWGGSDTTRVFSFDFK